ncbi:mitochondrial import inner membrane translocase subunit tim21 [Trapelia coarctata]|nr:mitochondrial import inner membrane translocase subunit tim21 [Trapelia coarctata]
MAIVRYMRALQFSGGRTLLLRTTRTYATQSTIGSSTKPSRKQVTIVNDDGRVNWNDLTTREKAARSTQKTFHFGIILIGLVMTGGAAYFLYTDVFASDSKTRIFNRAVDEVKASPQATAILGPGKQIRAFGEPTANKWARARPLASTVRTDRTGREHLLMHFNVEGPSGKGIVNLHMIKNADTSDYEYKYLTLDVKGG